ncbi:MAG: transcriptional repressor [Muribaculaceae bacterium]|nr:transcriptional repressor [Muribaculaceae bacterium]
MPLSNNTEVERFTIFLTENRLRKTPERFEILQSALYHKGHFDVDSLYRQMEEKGYHVSRATIYSTLELLCSAGIIRRLLFDTHQARYERAGQTHSHLVCTECGEIREVDLEEIDGTLARMEFPKFTPAYFSTCIYGICEKCKKKGAGDHKL